MGGSYLELPVRLRLPGRRARPGAHWQAALLRRKQRLLHHGRGGGRQTVGLLHGRYATHEHLCGRRALRRRRARRGRCTLCRPRWYRWCARCERIGRRRAGVSHCSVLGWRRGVLLDLRRQSGRRVGRAARRHLWRSVHLVSPRRRARFCAFDDRWLRFSRIRLGLLAPRARNAIFHAIR